jgi:branched-subunit amino acid ABC-type transport system permease component
MSIVPQLVANSIIAGAMYTLIALGFTLTFATAKFFNLAHGAFATVGGYITYSLLVQAGLSPWIAIPVGIVAAGAVAFIVHHTVFAPLRKRHSSNMVLLVASLGAYTVLQAVIAMIWTSEFKSLPLKTAERSIEFLGGIITRTQLFALIAALLIAAALIIFLKFTRAGRAITAIGDDEEVARVVGINTNRMMALVFVIGGVVAGVSGIFTGYDTGIEPGVGMPLLLKGVIAAIIGGVGNIYGAVLGAFLLAVVENFGIWKIAAEWKDAIAFGLLILFLLFRPRGILQK